MGRTKGRHHNEEVRLRETISATCRAVLWYVRRPMTGRHHRRLVLYSLARDVWKLAMTSSLAVGYTAVKFG